MQRDDKELLCVTLRRALEFVFEEKPAETKR